ncbi:MAG TPA: hypothetical protein V6D11_28255 [Waterburya sp.]
MNSDCEHIVRSSAMDSQARISGRKKWRSAVLYQLYPCGCAVKFACQLTWRQPMSAPALEQRITVSSA